MTVAGTEKKVFKVVISGFEERSERFRSIIIYQVFGLQQRRHGGTSFYWLYDLKKKFAMLGHLQNIGSRPHFK